MDMMNDETENENLKRKKIKLNNLKILKLHIIVHHLISFIRFTNQKCTGAGPRRATEATERQRDLPTPKA
jgi:hypothetical protein